MPFITGSANSIPELRTALLNGLVANGWTLDGSVIYKGDVFFEVTVPTGESQGENRMIRFLGGTGQAAGVLSGDAPIAPRLGFASGTTWTFPVSYNLHILTNPDEVYFMVRRDANDYQFSAFGQSNVPGLPGTGAWCTASLGNSYQSTDVCGIFETGVRFLTANQGIYAPFWGGVSAWQASRSAVLHHGLDGGDWAVTDGGTLTVGTLKACTAAVPHLGRSPNAWNSEANLVPIQPYLARASSKLSIVADLAHARFLRIDNYNPEEIIDLTPDFWMVYPFRRKDTAQRNGENNSLHSGTFGWAIRNDGP